MSIYQIIDSINDQVYTHVMDNMTKVRADKLGLDIRAGYTLYVDDECIAVSMDNDRSLQYYGGFEYIDKEYRSQVGDWVFYNREDDRVNDCLERFTENKSEELTEND
jgi:hypothetical protein